MTKQINKNTLFNTFGIDNFNSLEEVINSMPPSIVEYHLNSLDDMENEIYLNKRDIEKSVNFGEYNIYLDYSENIYLEVEFTEDTLTSSFF
ncbi:hypothetical protein CP960_07890 [Malaciobacter halophilus]|uniref:Uncharacterized protein n=1 Tax=Malaciobacter halophilus TaxID=197482 RepID=A0A2N1J2F0_9BACT|nr:hypothetical protein [Malaciobacter halophilus]AXH09767.1 hypothetical protein AHALO_1397 [Malaciobacter halophilus]PKI80736.1 hypothetical protein CP960_07890 [Malaciobacter halophilus]